jgi:hypothetical protein
MQVRKKVENTFLKSRKNILLILLDFTKLVKLSKIDLKYVFILYKNG